MIIEIPNENSIVKWKNADKDEWKVAEISDLIKAYEHEVNNSKPQIFDNCDMNVFEPERYMKGGKEE